MDSITNLIEAKRKIDEMVKSVQEISSTGKVITEPLRKELQRKKEEAEDILKRIKL